MFLNFDDKKFFKQEQFDFRTYSNGKQSTNNARVGWLIFLPQIKCEGKHQTQRLRSGVRSIDF